MPGYLARGRGEAPTENLLYVSPVRAWRSVERRTATYGDPFPLSASGEARKDSGAVERAVAELKEVTSENAELRSAARIPYEVVSPAGVLEGNRVRLHFESSSRPNRVAAAFICPSDPRIRKSGVGVLRCSTA